MAVSKNQKLGFLAAGLFLLMASPAFAANANFEVSAWVPYWKSASGTAAISPKLTLFTEVNPFIYTVKTNGTLYQAGKITDAEWTALKTNAKEQNVRFVPTVMWSDGDTIHTILSDPEKRKAHISSIMQEVYRYGYDGVDIDYEGKKAETNEYFTAFLKELHEAIGVNKWIMCTIESRTPLDARYASLEDVPDDMAYANDFAALNKYCDRIRIMAYDQGRIDLDLNASNTDPYIPVADVKWVEKVVSLALKEIDANKITVGIPTYGYEYDMYASDASSSKMLYSRLWSFNPNYATGVAQKLGLSTTRSGSGEAMLTFPASQSPEPGIALPNATRVLVWSDAEAIRQKIELAERLGIRGISIFKIDAGEDQGIWGLLANRKKGAGGAQKAIDLSLATETGTSESSSSSSTSGASDLVMPTVDLQSGMRSENVRTLQKFLNANGYAVATSGLGSKGNETLFFGAGTRGALMRFQKANGVPATGYYGPKTRAAIAAL